MYEVLVQSGREQDAQSVLVAAGLNPTVGRRRGAAVYFVRVGSAKELQTACEALKKAKVPFDRGTAEAEPVVEPEG